VHQVGKKGLSLYVYCIVIVLMATSFGLKSPSSSQYLQKPLEPWGIQYKNVNFMGPHIGLRTFEAETSSR